VRVSFVLRLDPLDLAQGRLVGEIEEVMTGQVGGVHSPADVVSFCTAAGGSTTSTHTKDLCTGGHE
jgi:hypothetical protein